MVETTRLLLYSVSKPTPSSDRFSNWLKWGRNDFIQHIRSGDVIAALSGVDRQGNLQSLYMPRLLSTPESGKSSIPTTIIGNISNEIGVFSILQAQISELGFVNSIEKFADIPTLLRPVTAVSPRLLNDTTWSDSEVELGVVTFSITVPFFFGQVPIVGNIWDVDFKTKMASVSPCHGEWAELILEAFEQYASHSGAVESIVDRIIMRKMQECLRPGYDGAAISDSAPRFYLSPFTKSEAYIDDQSFIRAVFNPTAPASTSAASTTTNRDSTATTANTTANPNPTTHTVPPATSNPIPPNGPPPIFGVNPPPPAAAAAPINVQPNPNMVTMDQYHQTLLQLLAAQQAASNNPQQVIVESREDKAKEKEAKHNAVMLRLLFIGGTIDWDDDKPSITNFVLPRFTTAMENILELPAGARVNQLRNLLLTVFHDEPDNRHQRFNALLNNMSMSHFSKNFVTALLNCTFQISNLESIMVEANAINILHFVKQNDIVKLDEAKKEQETQRNERDFDIAEIHRNKIKSTIEVLGTITDMSAIIPIAANFCGVLRAMFDIENGPTPVLYEVMMRVVDQLVHPDYPIWHARNKHRVPQLPFLFLNMMQTVLAKASIFSGNAVNTNIVESGGSLEGLQTTLVKKSVKLAGRFFANMEEYVQFGTVPTEVPIFTPNDCNPDKHGLVTSSNHSMALQAIAKTKSPTGSPEKKKQRSKSTAAAGRTEQENLGLFRVKEGTPLNATFPPGLKIKPCAFFCCQGKKCTKLKSACPMEHIVAWSKFEEEDRAKIIEFCKSKKTLWFDAVTIRNQYKSSTIPEDIAGLLGDATAPESM